MSLFCEAFGHKYVPKRIKFGSKSEWITVQVCSRCNGFKWQDTKIPVSTGRKSG